ncbi:DUF695 domain-containing protein [Maribacter sp. SA7]|uniref:DUF695 domain-containing protein n=1 Tax=Maribacter zhoushanensis TaxID=3030012 RepID=UPI0023EE0102|nr:DUF695 domain-containing protein [Maribacter zhoushanensis]MDF4202233.1 DUF695 domain-containing protein [Maribacter zhoushanensis]
MGIFDKIFGSSIDWNEIKNTTHVYPKDSISLLQLTTESGAIGTGWINKGYQDYKYKKFTPYNFLIVVNLADDIAEANSELNMGTIEDFFTDEMRKIGVAHIVARVVTDEGLNIEMYIENVKDSYEKLQEFIEDPKRLVTFNVEVNEDPKWRAVRDLMNI